MWIPAAQSFMPLMQAACQDHLLLKALLEAVAEVNQANKKKTIYFLSGSNHKHTIFNLFDCFCRHALWSLWSIKIWKHFWSLPLQRAFSSQEHGAHVHQQSRGAGVYLSSCVQKRLPLHNPNSQHCRIALLVNLSTRCREQWFLFSSTDSALNMSKLWFIFVSPWERILQKKKRDMFFYNKERNSMFQETQCLKRRNLMFAEFVRMFLLTSTTFLCIFYLGVKIKINT